MILHIQDESFASSGSFYRAGTRGDKRLNLTRFWDFTDGDEVNMLIIHDDILNVINVSRINLVDFWEKDQASNITEFLKTIIAPESTLLFDIKELEEIEKSDRVAIEGQLKELKVLARSRNKKIASDRKEQDKFTCKACGFHYNDKIVECHHLTPLSMAKESTVSLDGLITLCPTCHSVAHQLLKEESEKNIEAEILIGNIKIILDKIYKR